MLWVHATLVHASLFSYQRFERELSRAEQESYYGEMAIVAELFGTPPDVIPATLADLREYFAAQLDGSTITVTEPARQIARAIYRSPLRGPMRVVSPCAPARHHRAAPTPPARGVRPPPGAAARAAARGGRPLDAPRQPSDPGRREPHPPTQQHRRRLKASHPLRRRDAEQAEPGRERARGHVAEREPAGARAGVDVVAQHRAALVERGEGLAPARTGSCTAGAGPGARRVSATAPVRTPQGAARGRAPAGALERERDAGARRASSPARRKIERMRAWAYCRYGAVLPSNASIRSQSKT